MNKGNILIVDDEEKMRRVLRLFLEKEGYQITEAEDGKVALELSEQHQYDLVLLDVMMPGLDGWTVCREIRRYSEVPVVMLTARSEEYDKLFGFELGVDDYIIKPFSLREVTYRIQAVLRRTRNNGVAGNSDTLELGRIRVDLLGRQCTLDGYDLALTPKEYDLLTFLAVNTGQVFTREQLLKNVWGYEYFGDLRTVDTHIKQLREKLGECKTTIVTVWGTGYKFKAGE